MKMEIQPQADPKIKEKENIGISITFLLVRGERTLHHWLNTEQREQGTVRSPQTPFPSLLLKEGLIFNSQILRDVS